MLHQRQLDIVKKKLLKIQQSIKITNLKPSDWYQRIIEKIRYGVADNNLIKFSKSVISLGMTKKIKASIENRPMSNNLFQNLNFQQKQCIKGYTSRNLKSLLKSNIIQSIRIKQPIQKHCEVIIQQIQNDSYQMSITYKRRAKRPICGASSNGLAPYTRKKVQLLYKTILTSQFLLNLKREVHMKSLDWNQGYDKRKKNDQQKVKKSGHKLEVDEDIQSMDDDQFFWIDKFICLHKQKFNGLIAMVQGSKLAYVQNTAKPEEVMLQDLEDDNQSDEQNNQQVNKQN